MAQTYRERLWPGPMGWVGLVGLGALLGVVLLPLRVGPALVVGAAGVVIALVAGVLSAPRVEVVGGRLRAGPAQIPLALLGAARALTGGELRAALGPELDARAYVCLRGWVRSAVRVELADPADPTPYWIVSTRRPAALLATLADGRTPPQL